MRIAFGCVMSLLIAAAVPSADVESATLSIKQYAQELRQIREALKNQEYAGASSRAARVMKVKIRSGRELLEPDRRALAPITSAGAAGLQKSEILLTRLNVLIDSLPPEHAAEASAPLAKSDPALLENLRLEQAFTTPEQGGDVPKIRDDLGLLNKIGKLAMDALKWVGSQLGAVFQWIGKLFVIGAKAQPSEYIGPFTLTALLMVAGLCALLVWDIIKKRRAENGAQPVVSAPVKTEARDADPLSRNANEWEVYARKLAASGQYRESIRAWYHAVLVTLYRTGTLHYRKGRTNWEYCYSLSPSIPWRPQFMELTRRFEFEWYGKHSSSAEDFEACSQQAQTILDTVEPTGGRR